jgi:hypothetical protein
LAQGGLLFEFVIMTITELYEKLSNKDFQDHLTGNLFFPAYMYTYDPAKEYEIDQEILKIKERLHRPNNYLDVLVLDISEVFLDYLKTTKFGRNTKYDFYMENEAKNPKAVDKALRSDAYDGRFLDYLDQLIKDHLEKADDYEVAYVFLKGIGNAFPYIRVSRFMSNFEKYIQGYKMIIFYPGKAKQYYSMFGLLDDEHLYRAIKLIND